MFKAKMFFKSLLLLTFLGAFLGGCATQSPAPATAGQASEFYYLIGSGDSLNIQVWHNPDVSMTVSVRPDGKISMPLVEDMPAANKTPSQLARDLEKALSKYIQDPVVTVIVSTFAGPFSQQVRVIGQATKPQALPYRDKLTLLDVMIAVGGLTDFAAGNRASIVRTVDGKQQQLRVRLESLIRDGDITANVEMLPGDVLIIPESYF